jgi:hypothetical protein
MVLYWNIGIGLTLICMGMGHSDQKVGNKSFKGTNIGLIKNNFYNFIFVIVTKFSFRIRY